MSKRTCIGNPRVAVAYLRVSTDEQRLGPEAQRAAIEAWAVREGASVVSWHIDAGVSGASPIDARKALCEALAALREHGAGAFLVAKRDRVARDVAVMATIENAVEKAGAKVISADGQGNGDDDGAALMRDMTAVLASHERRLIRSRTRAALAVKKARGERVRQVPYGFALAADGVHLEEVESEQATVQRARQLVGDGLSLRAVAVALANEGRVSRVGRAFVAVQVSRMLAQPAR